MKKALPAPACNGGYTISQIRSIMGDRERDFWNWMNGQTMMSCSALLWDHKAQKYVPSGCQKAHGTVIYRQDVEQFLKGGAPLD